MGCWPMYGSGVWGWGEGQPQCGALECQPHPLTSDSSQATGPGAVLIPLTRASLSCPPLGPPAHPHHIVSLTLLGTPCVPLGHVYCSGGCLTAVATVPASLLVTPLCSLPCNCLSFCSF